MKNYIYILPLLFLCFFSACVSSNSPSQANRLRLNLGGEPQSLDPRKARRLGDLSVIQMTFEGLMRVNKEEKPECALAERYKVSDDLKTYTFFLRDSLWSNGKPVVAGDFAYAWKQILNPLFPADNAFQLYVIKNGKNAKTGKVSVDKIGVIALDDKTLQVELESPTPYFLELLAFPAFFPVPEKVDRYNAHWAEKASTFVCNGPFFLKEWKHQDHLTVKKNENYWDKQAVKLEEIDLFMVEQSTEVNMYEKKELDWAGSPLSVLPIDALPRFKAQDVLEKKPLLGTYFFRINTSRAPFNDPEIRRAFALVLNRDAIVEHVLGGSHLPAFGLVPSWMGLQENPYFSDHALSHAQALLKEALKKNGFTCESFPPITLTYPNTERNHLVAQTVQQQWLDAFGIQVHLEALEAKVLFDRISKQDFHLAIGSWIADFNDPINFLEVFKFKKASTNNTQWESAQYIELLDHSANVLDPKQRFQVLRQSEALLMEEMPIIPIFHYAMLYMKQDKLKGVVLSSMGHIDFKWAYWENQDKNSTLEDSNRTEKEIR